MTRPKIAVHADVRVLNPLISLCEELGFACKRRGYGLEEISTPSEAHLIWGMAFRPDTCHKLAELGNVFFAENGWFTQRTGCYIDPKGTNAMSSICNANLEKQLSKEQSQKVSDFLSNLRERVKRKPIQEEKGYILVILQVEKDTQLLFWSGCDASYPNRQVWFVNQVCQAFPNERLIIRLHKRDMSLVVRLKANCPALIQHQNVSFKSDGTSYDWIIGAKAVVGINSTVLLEALTYYKPVCAMGMGVFTDNGVMLECKGNPSILTKLPEYQPDREQITKFLHLLMERQIPYRLKATNVNKYPIFLKMLECARRIA